MEIFALLFVILICIIFIFIGAYIIYDSTKYKKTTAIVINAIDLTNIDKNYIIDIQYYINSTKYVYKNINYKSDDEVKINDTIDIYYKKTNYKNIIFKNKIYFGLFVLFMSLFFLVLFSVIFFSFM